MTTSGRGGRATGMGRRLEYRLAHAIIGAVFGGFVAAAALAARSATSAYAIVAAASTALAAGGYVMGRLQDELWARSSTDTLTGIANRRYFEQRLRTALAAASRHELPVALLLIDVDRLKQINDRLGHRAGDRALRTVADTLRLHFRSTDVVARCGGDEFAVLAPFTGLRTAHELADRVRRDLPAEVYGPDGHRSNLVEPLTISVGVAASRGPGDATDLIDAADRALYSAKARGRDCVVLVTTATPNPDLVEAA